MTHAFEDSADATASAPTLGESFTAEFREFFRVYRELCR